MAKVININELLKDVKIKSYKGEITSFCTDLKYNLNQCFYYFYKDSFQMAKIVSIATTKEMNVFLYKIKIL